MKVKALKLGYYDNKRRREGQVFDIKNEKEFSEKWMEYVEKDEKPSVKVEKPREAKALSQAMGKVGATPTGNQDVI
jgi:hypothetical protein